MTMNLKDQEIIKQLCREGRLSDDTIVELMDAEGVEVNRAEVKKIRSENIETHYWIWILVAFSTIGILFGVMQ